MTLPLPLDCLIALRSIRYDAVDRRALLRVCKYVPFTTNMPITIDSVYVSARVYMYSFRMFRSGHLAFCVSRGSDHDRPGMESPGLSASCVRWVHMSRFWKHCCRRPLNRRNVNAIKSNRGEPSRGPRCVRAVRQAAMQHSIIWEGGRGSGDRRRFGFVRDDITYRMRGRLGSCRSGARVRVRSGSSPGRS